MYDDIIACIFVKLNTCYVKLRCVLGGKYSDLHSERSCGDKDLASVGKITLQESHAMS